MAHWRAFWKLEPWGALRDNHHTATLIDTYLRFKTPHDKQSSLPPISTYMYEHETDRADREAGEKQKKFEAAGQFLRDQLRARMKKGKATDD